MASRIPPSLSWLIDKRARLAAEVEKTRASIAEAQRLIKEFKVIERDLAAVDLSLKLHEIQVDLEAIAPIASQYLRIQLPRGELTRSIFLCLQLRGNQPTKFSEIVSFIIARHADLSQSTKTDRKDLNKSVHYRLKNLAREGKLCRHHSADDNKEGIWSLASLD